MAQLLVRNLPDEVKESLRARARDHGLSMEAEARRILVDVVMGDRSDPVIEWLDASDRLRRDSLAVDELPLPDRLPSREVQPL